VVQFKYGAGAPGDHARHIDPGVNVADLYPGGKLGFRYRSFDGGDGILRPDYYTPVNARRRAETNSEQFVFGPGTGVNHCHGHSGRSNIQTNNDVTCRSGQGRFPLHHRLLKL
jgi:hypothetical protein